MPGPWTRPRAIGAARRLPVAGHVSVVLLVAAAGLGGARRAGAQDLSCASGSTEIRRLEFVGNAHFDDDSLANAIVTTPSSWSRRVLHIFGTRRCLDRVEFPRDRLRLIIYYRNHGFINAAVDTAVHVVRPGVADVRFTIHEGRPIRVQSVTIDGLESLPPNEHRAIVSDLPVRVGGLFDKGDRGTIDATRDTLRVRLLNAGYPFAEVLRSYASDTAQRTGTVVYSARIGPRARIDSVIVNVQPRVAGRAPDISPDAVRSVMGLKPGHVFRLNDVLAAQRSLFQTNAFQHISVGLAADTTGGGPASGAATAAGPADTLVAVEADVVEGYMHTARVGAGWATLDCFRTQAEYDDRDFLGGLRLLRIQGSVTKIGIGAPLGVAHGSLCPQAKGDIYSDTLNYGLSATLRSPVLFGAQLDPTATLFSERRSEYNAYVRSTPIGAAFSLTRRLSSSLSISPEYRVSLGRTTAQPALYCAVFNLCTPEDIKPEQELLPLAVAGALAVQDLRDNVYNPTRGSLVSVEGLSGSRYLGSAARFQFNKASADGAGYFALAGGVLAGRLRLGAVAPYGAAAAGFVPPDQRLYAGGPTTVRGFQQNELGPVVYIPNHVVTTVVNGDTVKRALPDSGERVVPEGGNWSVVGNLEYRFPSPVLHGLLWWAVFADAGQVWTGNVAHIRGLLWTPGVGVRVFTPVGPVRLDVGYNPYARPAGAAYFNAPATVIVGGRPVPTPGDVPLYCVSPGNTIPVHTKFVGPDRIPIPEQDAGHPCPATYIPNQATGFLRKLTFNLSIGQAF